MVVYLTTMKRILALAALFFLSLGALANAQDEALTQRKLQWKSVPGAKAYILEVRNGLGDSILNKTLETTSFDISLPPGEYEVRITTLNKFLKPASVSPWSKLSIMRSILPVPQSISAETLIAGKKDQVLSVSGSGFMPYTLLSLESENGKASGSILSQSGNKISAVFDLSSLAPGEYRLKVSNPPGKEAFAPGSVRVWKESEALAKIASGEASASSGERIVERIVEVPVEKIVERIVEVPVDRIVEVPVDRIVEVPVDRIVEVPVDRIVEVPVERAGSETVVEKIVERIVEVPVDRIVEKIVEVPVDRIVERIVEVPVDRVTEKQVEVPVEKIVEKIVEVPVETIVEVPVEKIVEKRLRVPVGGSGGISLFIGYPFVITLADFDNAFAASVVGTQIAFQADIGNGFLHTMPVFNLIALELGASFSDFTGRPAPIQAQLSLIDLNGKIIMRSRFRTPLQIAAYTGLGTTFNWIRKSSLFLTEPVVEHSQDFSLNAGASLSLELKQGPVIEAFGEYLNLFYSNLSYHAIRSGIRFGWRFR